MTGKVRGSLVTALVVIGLVLSASGAPAQSTALDTGIAYLHATQALDGSWGGTSSSLATVLQTTATTARTLQLLGLTDGNLTDAVGFLAAQTPATVDDLAATLEVLAASGADVATRVASLEAAQGADGGWGRDLDGTRPSEVVDTVSALRALRVAGALAAGTAATGVAFLLGQQNPDGGWGVLAGQPSEVFHTALALLVLRDVQHLFDLTAPIGAGSQFLAGQQNADGRIGGSVFETAVAFQALVRLSFDPTRRTAALAHLTSTQSADGSWDGDAFSTALVLRALQDARTVADAQIQAITLSRDGIVTDAFLAYQTLAISVTTGTPDVVLQAVVQDGSGTLFATQVQGSQFLFDTRALAPGSYTVLVRAVDPVTGILVDQRSVTFTVQATVAVANAALDVTPLFTHVGATEALSVTLSLANRSNTPATLRIEHEIKTSSGGVVNSGTTSLSLPVDAPLSSTSLATFSHTFAQSGDYPVQAKVFDGTRLLATVTGSIAVAPAVRIEPTKTLTPSTVLPDGDKRIRIEIRLRGVEQPQP